MKGQPWMAAEWETVPGPEMNKEILKARAKALAREPEVSEAEESKMEVVEFLLAHENYAIESKYICEVCQLKEHTPVPCTPAFVLGIFNLRGYILTVIDLKNFFNLPKKGITDLNKVVVVETGEIKVGIVVDAILGTKNVPLKKIQPLLPASTGLNPDYVKGVTGERLIILDAVKILSEKRIDVNEEV